MRSAGMQSQSTDAATSPTPTNSDIMMSPLSEVARKDQDVDRDAEAVAELDETPSFWVGREPIREQQGTAREPFLVELEDEVEHTGFWTHYICHLVRVTFLFSHGLTVFTVSSALGNLDQASWLLLFTAAWVGDSLCAALLVWSWFASCPYIKHCHREGKVQLGVYPSFLTEVLPEIVLSIFGLIFLILIMIAEYLLCKFLTSVQQGDEAHLVSSVVFLSIVAVLALCHGTLLTRNSPLYLGVGGSVLISLVIFVVAHRRGPQEQAWVLAPPFVAALVISIAGLKRLCYNRSRLGNEERCLRFLEVALLLSLSFELLQIGSAVGVGKLHEASSDGMFAGGILSTIALCRARIYVWEARSGSLLQRTIDEVAVPGEGIFDEDEMPSNDQEIQLSVDVLRGTMAL